MQDNIKKDALSYARQVQLENLVFFFFFLLIAPFVGNFLRSVDLQKSNTLYNHRLKPRVLGLLGSYGCNHRFLWDVLVIGVIFSILVVASAFALVLVACIAFYMLQDAINLVGNFTCSF